MSVRVQLLRSADMDSVERVDRSQGSRYGCVRPAGLFESGPGSNATTVIRLSPMGILVRFLIAQLRVRQRRMGPAAEGPTRGGGANLKVAAARLEQWKRT